MALLAMLATGLGASILPWGSIAPAQEVPTCTLSDDMTTALANDMSATSSPPVQSIQIDYIIVVSRSRPFNGQLFCSESTCEFGTENMGPVVCSSQSSSSLVSAEADDPLPNAVIDEVSQLSIARYSNSSNQLCIAFGDVDKCKTLVFGGPD